MQNLSCGCFNENLPIAPTLQKSEFLHDLSGSFAINTHHDQLKGHFSWMLQLRKPLPKGAFMEAHFPADGRLITKKVFRVPLMLIQDDNKKEAQNATYYAISPELDDLKCGIYQVEVKIYKDQRRMETLSSHNSQILSRVDTSNCSKNEFMQTMQRLSNNA